MNKSVILTLDGPNIDLLPGAISGTILNNNGFYPSLICECHRRGAPSATVGVGIIPLPRSLMLFLLWLTAGRFTLAN